MRTIRLVGVGIVAWVAVHGLILGLGVGALVSLHTVSGPGCNENEVVAWDGDQHSVCLSIEDLDIDAYYQGRFE